MRHLLLTLACLAALTALGAGGASSRTGGTGAHAAATPAVRQALARLVTDTKRLPARGAKAKKLKRGLVRTATRARKTAAKSACGAIPLVGRYERQLRRLKRSRPPKTRAKRPIATRGLLEADAVAVRAALLADPRARRCGGPSESPAASVQMKLLSSDTKQVKMHVTLPQARVTFRRLGGRDWSELSMDGMSPAGDPGDPGVPTVTEQLAVPTGANVSVTFSNVSSYTVPGVTLLPQQPEAIDGKASAGRPPAAIFRDPKLAIDKAAYKSNQPFPAQAADAGPIGDMRDLRIGGAQIAGAQYRPKSHKLRVITGMDVQVDFGGDNKGTFGDARLTDPFNAPFARLYREAVQNYNVVTANPGSTIFTFCGTEVLIVTPADLRPAAETLKTQKTFEGFETRIVETGAAPAQIGTTNTQIQTFIRNELNSSCWIRPSYVVLFGNTAELPTFEVPCGPGGDVTKCTIGSDLPYGLKDDADYYADVAVGRIPAPDLATANTVVNKIVGYETTAPAGLADDFYHHFTVTSAFETRYICELNEGASGTPNCNPDAGPVTGHWVRHPEISQDGRGFTWVAEKVRDAMVAKGYTVDRLYNADEDVDPQTFYDGTPMPGAIRKPGFAWDSNTPEMVNAFNDGRAIFFHRDHGWEDGWASPTLSSVDIPSLTNGTQLPVAFGVNCSSAAFDNPGHPSFAELLLQHPGGGSVGGFGDSRVSNTWANNNISRGFFDALFPNLVPSYGAPDPIKRMGDVLVAGKLYLGTSDPGAVYGHGHLYGYFGDPTMQLWIDPPRVFDPSRLAAVVHHEPPPFKRPPGPGPDPAPYWVQVAVPDPGAEGTWATLEQKGVTLGRGLVHDGQAIIFPYAANSQTPFGGEVKLQNESFFAAQTAVQGR